MRYSPKWLGLVALTALMVPLVQKPGFSEETRFIPHSERLQDERPLAMRDVTVLGNPLAEQSRSQDYYESPPFPTGGASSTTFLKEKLPTAKSQRELQIDAMSVEAGTKGAVKQTRQMQEDTEPLLQVEGALEPGDEVRSSDNSLYDMHVFEGEAGQAVIITLESEEFDTFLSLLDEEYEAVATNDDVSSEDNNSLIAVVLPETGTYKVIANAFDEAGQGNYYLTVLPVKSDHPAIKVSQADEMNRRGVSLTNTAQYPEALDLFKQALAVCQEASVRESLLQESQRCEEESLNNIGGIYDNLGQYLEALNYYQQSLLIAQEMADRSSEAVSLSNIGNVYSRLGQYSEALEYHQMSLMIRQEIGEQTNVAISLNNIGSIYEDLGEYHKALDFYQQSLLVFQKTGDISREAVVINNIGHTYSQLGKYIDALELYKRALEIHRDAGNKRLEGATLNNIGGIYQDLGNYVEALNFYEQALTIRQDIGDRNGKAISLNNIGVTYANLGEYLKALSYYEQALVIHKEIGSEPGEAGTLNNIGLTHFLLGNYPKALDYYQQALYIRRKIGDPSGEASSLNAIGGVYTKSGQYAKALDFYQQALLIQQQIGDRSNESVSLNNIGSTYLHLNQPLEALDYYQRSLAISQEIGDRSSEATTINNIGSVYIRLEQYQDALDHHQNSLDIAQEIGDRNSEAFSLNNIGYVAQELGQHSEALKYYQQSLEIVQEIRDPSNEATLLNNIGGLYSDLGQPDQALNYYQQALVIRQRIGDRVYEAASLGNIGSLLRKRNHSELAIVFYKQSVNVYESIRNQLISLDTELQQSYTESIADTYRNLADLLLQNDRILEAQRVLDLLKVQELEEYLENVRGNAETASGITYWRPEQEILDRYQALQDEVAALAQELNDLEAKAKAGTITSTEDKRRREMAQLQRELLAQFNAFIDSEDIQAFLDQLKQVDEVYDQTVKLDSLTRQKDDLEQLQAVLFYPLILEDRLELVVVVPNAEPIRRTVEGVGRTQLNTVITEFRQALDSPHSDATAPAQKLYRWLIEPLEADLAAAGVETIIYAPDGALRYIPLAALHDGDQWLVERFRINNITAVSLEEWDTPPAGERRILAGAFADELTSHPVGENLFRGLPYAGKEVEGLQATLPSTTALYDGDFSLARILDDLGIISVLHFATHAAVVPGDASESFILFGNGDAPNLRDISDWPLDNIDLVVLSACETGLGGFDNNGEQILGLGYQFQNQGARAVIASLWQVNDGGTQALMNAFYSVFLQNNLPKAEALRQAQIALINDDYDAVGGERGDIEIISSTTGQPLTGDDLSHPYYWAPFILIGNGL